MYLLLCTYESSSLVGSDCKASWYRVQYANKHVIGVRRAAGVPATGCGLTLLRIRALLHKRSRLKG